ncbi:hypothetical protein CQA53_06290 [Helicobacter didelphidarum]|uniref:Uncharacterized protein n=1 Tax=Helicobacter didelphidarum TaxID=2040648 RepID=A0A3D8IJI8_9HELI|nr:hypothetical protein [Helicobacter didelphidarum]RDU65379.1 hypothetical protein CQA53_06290 [Helicobacter didelphidarum]
MDKRDKDYYKAVLDIIKNIITALFVAELGLIGYTYNTSDYIVGITIFINAVILLFLIIWYFDMAENLRD